MYVQMNDVAKPIRSYGRIKARTLKPRQARLIETLLPRIAVPAAGAIEVDPGRGAILEIGFGAGEHLAAQAGAHPETDFIGVEPFLNGVGACLAGIETAGLTNVRLHAGDARDVLARLPDGMLDRVYILFPDPWPKTRHWKRRLIQAPVVAELARVLKPGGEVRFATDWGDYAAWTLALFLNSPAFAWAAERADDWRKPWPGHVRTRYEAKGLGDCAPIFLRFARRG